jgi:16S rRNA processing protein RimM
VLGAHGIRGELKCRVVTDFPRQRFRRGAEVFMRGAAYVVQGVRLQGDYALLRLAGLTDRTTAEALRGADVEVPRAATVPLPRGQYYWFQVIGLQVDDVTTGEDLGRVVDILETGANDVYIVRGARGEVLIPAIKDVIQEIDPAGGRMRVAPLPGMLPAPRRG